MSDMKKNEDWNERATGISLKSQEHKNEWEEIIKRKVMAKSPGLTENIGQIPQSTIH